jgi:hypothetical protein
VTRSDAISPPKLAIAAHLKGVRSAPVVTADAADRRGPVCQRRAKDRHCEGRIGARSSSFSSTRHPSGRGTGSKHGEVLRNQAWLVQRVHFLSAHGCPLYAVLSAMSHQPMPKETGRSSCVQHLLNTECWRVATRSNVDELETRRSIVFSVRSHVIHPSRSTKHPLSFTCALTCSLGPGQAYERSY